MEISRHWRLRHERYNLTANTCPHCGRQYATPRMLCVDCHASPVASRYHFVVAQATAEPVTERKIA